MKSFILIEPATQRVSALEGLEPRKDDSIDDLHTVINCEIIASFKSSITPDGPRYVFTCDDEALLKDDTEYFTMLPHWDYPVAGNILISDLDEEGYMTPCECSLREVANTAIFYQKVFDPKIKKHRIVPME